MEKQSSAYTATYHAGQHPAFLTCLLIGASIIVGKLYDALVPPSSEDYWLKYWALALTWGAAACYAYKWANSIRFTDAGVEKCCFGWKYRSWSWAQIAQTGVALRYQGHKTILVLTPSGCPKYNGGFITYYVERYQLKLIFLDATEFNKAIVEKYCGPLDYEMK